MKTSNEYTQDPSLCPFCNSDNVEAGYLETDGNSAWQRITCLDCRKEWNDLYDLVGYEEIK